MTNIEYFMQHVTDGYSLTKVYRYLGCGCLQTRYPHDQKEIHRKVCLSDEYRGEEGCSKCRAKFWDSEYNEEWSEEVWNH